LKPRWANRKAALQLGERNADTADRALDLATSGFDDVVEIALLAFPDDDVAAPRADPFEAREHFLNARRWKQGEHAVPQIGQGKYSRDEAGAASHRFRHGAAGGGVARGNLVEGNENVQCLILDDQQLDVADRPAASYFRRAPVQRMTAIAHAADHHQSPAALKDKEHLASKQEYRVAIARVRGQRIATARGMLDNRNVCNFAQPPGGHGAQRRQHGKLLRRCAARSRA